MNQFYHIDVYQGDAKYPNCTEKFKVNGWGTVEAIITDLAFIKKYGSVEQSTIEGLREWAFYSAFGSINHYQDNELDTIYDTIYVTQYTGNTICIEGPTTS